LVEALVRLAIRITTLLCTAALSAAWSCGSDKSGESSSERGGKSSQAATGGIRPEPNLVRTTDLPDACDLIPEAEIERIAGAIVGPPEHKEKGCSYSFAVDSTTTEWARRRQLEASGADSRYLDLYFPRPSLFVEADVTGPPLTNPQGGPAAPDGWDAVGSRPFRSRFIGRIGHVTITVEQKSLGLPPDTLVSLAGRVRDRIPDLPFAHPVADRSGSPPAGPDPCSVLTRAEAETVLGQLAVAPYRSHEGSPLSDPAGKSCTYLTPGHRALVLTPEWTYGKNVLEAERMVGGVVSQVADVFDMVADTLEGQWDDAVAGLSGDLIFLKGAHALSIGYRTSSTDATGAIRLAGPALKRLAAVP
jgi:hypothetical protein